MTDNIYASARDDGKPWSLPADFLPVPEGYSAQRTVVNLKDFNHNQLTQLAIEYNKASDVEDDPFGRVLKGIPERAQLRPGSKEPVSHYMGLQGLPPHGKYAKAWRKLIRGSRQLLDDDAGPVAKVRGVAGRCCFKVVAVLWSNNLFLLPCLDQHATRMHQCLGSTRELSSASCMLTKALQSITALFGNCWCPD